MASDIQSLLKDLYINELNNAWSTGLDKGSSADTVIKDIISPVDGKKNCIGKICHRP